MSALAQGPQRLSAAVSAFSQLTSADGPMSRLFVLPDSAGAFVLTYFPETGSSPMLQGNAWNQAIAACTDAHHVAAAWFGGLRPRAAGAHRSVSQFAARAATVCAATDALVTGTDAARRQQGIDQLRALEKEARALADGCTALSRDIGAYCPSVERVVGPLIPISNNVNLWQSADETELQHLQQGLVRGTTRPLETLQGAWGALADDLKLAADTVERDVVSAPGLIAEIGFTEAAAAWQQLEAEADAVDPDSHLSSDFMPRSLGWYHVELDESSTESPYIQFEVHAGPDGSVAMGAPGSSSVTVERLSGGDVAYFRVRFDATGTCLGSPNGVPVPGMPMGHAAWTNADHQKWRPVRANQAGFALATDRHDGGGTTISGWYLVQRATGLIASTRVGQPLPSKWSAGMNVPLIQNVAFDANATHRGYSVFQAR